MYKSTPYTQSYFDGTFTISFVEDDTFLHKIFDLTAPRQRLNWETNLRKALKNIPYVDAEEEINRLRKTIKKYLNKIYSNIGQEKL